MTDRKTLMVGLGLGGLVAAGAAWWAKSRTERRPERRPERADRVVHRSARYQRNLQLARAGVTAGASIAGAKVAGLVVDEQRAAELRDKAHLRSAEQVAEVLGNMKGAMMKLGQMASYIDQGLPEPVRDALAQLQQDAPPMEPGLAIRTVEASLGGRLSTFFRDFDEEPIAAASIGQVHRAVTLDGRDAAVKVQYPGIAEVIRADLGNVDMLFSAMGVLFAGLDPQTIIDELKARLSEELDYALEAANQRTFAHWYRDHPTIHVPEVFDDLSTEHVLSTEFVTGSRWQSGMEWDQAQKDLIGETIYRYAFGGIYRLHAFNGDPHPGNYVLGGDGRVSFLDYGLVKRFTAAEIEQFQVMIEAMLAGDAGQYRTIVEGLGLLRHDPAFTDEEVAAYFSHFYTHVAEDRTITIDAEWSAEALRRYFDLSGPYAELIKAANLPSSMVVVQRINLGTFALLGELGATANWRRIAEEIWPNVRGGPSTPMGEEIKAWEHHRQATDPTWKPWG